MKTPSAILVAIALWLVPSPGQAQPVETELTGVTAEVIELRQAGGLTFLAVRFTNGGPAEEDSTRDRADRVTLVDTKSKKKYLPLKDANGQFIAGPIGDWIEGGRIRLMIPAKQSTPIAPNAKQGGSDDPAGRARNRRVEVVVRKRAE